MRRRTQGSLDRFSRSRQNSARQANPLDPLDSSETVNILITPRIIGDGRHDHSVNRSVYDIASKLDESAEIEHPFLWDSHDQTNHSVWAGRHSDNDLSRKSATIRWDLRGATGILVLHFNKELIQDDAPVYGHILPP